MIETIGKARTVKEAANALTEITQYNDKPLCGEIRLLDTRKHIHFRQEFTTRLMRKTLHDFLSNTYSDKINNRGWFISIIIY